MNSCLLLLAFALVFCSVTARHPIIGFDSPTKIDGYYIVQYHENVTMDTITDRIKRITLKQTNEVKHIYNINDEFKGFAAKLDAESLEEYLEDPLVKEVHSDTVVSLDANSCGTTQASPPSWGLRRTSSYGSAMKAQYFYNYDYAGNGVRVYVIDTGIYTAHSEFQGRAFHAANYVDSINQDQNGHGTHCAGTIGGVNVGIAKRASLYAVKVLGANGSGSNSGVIAGVNYVANQAATYSVVGSMSLGGTYNAASNNAVTAAVNAGATMVVAAGNSNANACNYSPASTPSAITVGSTTSTNARSSFSNYGNCVHIFAPGTSIYSSYIGGTSAYSTLSGTSMACPHVAGVAALILSEGWISPAAVKSRITTQGQKNLISGVGAGSPNNLAYNYCDEN